MKVNYSDYEITPLDVIMRDFTVTDSLGQVVDYGNVIVMNYSDETVNRAVVHAEFRRMLKKSYVRGGQKIPL